MSDGANHTGGAEAEGPPLSLRFDLCSKPGAATTDLPALLEATKWPWQ